MEPDLEEVLWGQVNLFHRADVSLNLRGEAVGIAEIRMRRPLPDNKHRAIVFQRRQLTGNFREQ